MTSSTSYTSSKLSHDNSFVTLFPLSQSQSTNNSPLNKLKPVFLFIFYVFAVGLCAQTTELDRAAKRLHASYFIEQDSSLTIEEVLKLESFKTSNDLSLEAGHTYWFRIDFKNELDTLQTQELWYLRTSHFKEAMLYYYKDGSIEQKPFGKVQKEQATKSLIYSNGVLFKKDNLVSDRYLYVRTKTYFSHSAPVYFNYVSNTSNRFYTDYYTNKDFEKLAPSLYYFGACFILFLTFIVIFLNIREVEFLYYPLYILFSAIYLVGLDIPTLSNFFEIKIGVWIGLISQVLINLFYVLFAKYYLNTKNKYPLLDVIINSAVLFLFFLIVSHIIAYFSGLYQTQEIILNIQRVVMTIFGLFCMLYLLLKAKDRLAFFIVTGSFLYMIGALIFWMTPNKYYMMGGSMLEIIIFSLGLAYKIKLEYEGKMTLQREVSVKEISAKRAQINPHFFFNSLNSIQHLILDNKRNTALNYLNKFSKLARSVLESSYETTVTFTEEIALLNSYLELESLRFDQAFSYSIKIDDNIETDNIEIPLMLIQPFAENAIIHGLVGKKDGDKTLELRFLKEDDFYIIEIEDNGIGRQRVDPEVKKEKSRGMEITKKRLKMLDISEQHKNTIEIIDKYDSHGQPCGTKVIIRLYNP